MTQPSIAWPRRFECYTEEFLFQHPGYVVRSSAPLRVQVPTHHGPEDDAVAMACQEARLNEATVATRGLEEVYTRQVEAAQIAHLAWSQRRMQTTGTLQQLAWSTVHAVANLAAPLLPAAPVRLSLQRPSTLTLLAHHLGTTYIAQKTAQQIAHAQIRVATLERELATLKENLRELRTAVNRDQSVAVKTPQNLAHFPKFRDRLAGSLHTHLGVQSALANPEKSYDERRTGLAQVLGAPLYTALVPVLLSDGDTADTPASTCAPEPRAQSPHRPDGEQVLSE